MKRDDESAAGRAAEGDLGDPLAVVGSFIDGINSHAPGRLAELLSDDHVFVDGAGEETTGRRAVRDAWEGFFALFPDYRIEVETTVRSGNVIAVFGSASGTAVGEGGRDERRWSLPVAWKAIVGDGRVRHWQVYCETEPMRRSLASRSEE